MMAAHRMTMCRVISFWALILAVCLSLATAWSPFLQTNFLAIRESSQVEWFEQKLDHTDPLNTRCWLQRYYASTDYKGRGNFPVFLNLGGEGEERQGFSSEEMSVYARKYGALMFTLEHRYYGKSLPTRDLSTPNLRFLSSQQALADTALFIEGMKNKFNLTSENKWVLFGGSYAGNLAAWARLKYPHLVFAAVSSSAPVLAQVDFPGYFEVVRQVLASHDRMCAENVHRAALELEKMLLHPRTAEFAYRRLNLCEIPKSKNDLAVIALSLATPFIRAVQYNNTSGIRSGMVSVVCRSMLDAETPLDLLEKYIDLQRAPGTCMSLSRTEMQLLNLIDPYYSNGSRQWTYQTCTEFGYFHTSSTDEALFGSLITLQYHLDKCKQLFGPDFSASRIEENIKRTNRIYGGLEVASSVSRVVFVQGTGDPWHVLGVNRSKNKDAPAILMDGASHCADAYAYMSTTAVLDAQNEIGHLIGKWLTESEGAQ